MLSLFFLLQRKKNGGNGEREKKKKNEKENETESCKSFASCAFIHTYDST